MSEEFDDYKLDEEGNLIISPVALMLFQFLPTDAAKRLEARWKRIEDGLRAQRGC